MNARVQPPLGRHIHHFHGGMKLRHHKQISVEVPSSQPDLPPVLHIPLRQHAGTPAEPVVRIGEQVVRGQLLAQGRAVDSVSVHAPAAGRVAAIRAHPVPNASGTPETCIRLETAASESNEPEQLMPPLSGEGLNPDSILTRTREAGIAGLGGAVFPTHQKMSRGIASHDIHTVLLNGAECEPYISCDEMLMREQPEKVIRGGVLLAMAVGAESVIIGIEDQMGVVAGVLQEALKGMSTEGLHVLIRQVQTTLQNCLDDDGLPGTVIGRQNHLLSIYRKMRDQRKPFAEIMDVFGFRIITDDVDTCYRILGAVHNLYKPVPGRFKDYIAIPKANGYQSLHTTLFGANGIPVEVQIRTREMEAMANNGIAAHWLYKAGQTEHPIALGSHARAREWVRGLLEMQRHAGDSLEFIEHVKNDLFPDDVYVFTPRGDIMELPLGATVVDFAYAVHTDIGNHCIACRIDRHLAPLSTRLESGQTVEIITAPGARPSLAWLSFVITAKARSAIRHALKHQQRSESIQLGRRLLNRALADYATSLEALPEAPLLRLLDEFELHHIDDLLESIGLGTRMAHAVARRLTDGAHQEKAHAVTGPEGAVTIHGTEGMVISFARCCHPLPGDSVIGHLSMGKGIVVHRSSCRNIADLRSEPDKLLALQWSSGISGDFPVALRIEIESRRGLVAELASLVTDADANIERVGIEERDARLSIVNLTLAVRDRVHLARIIKRLRNLSHVGRISRVHN